MADLPATSPAPSPRTLRWSRASTGALLGAIVWLELIAIGLPGILTGTSGYTITPAAPIIGALLGLTRVRPLLWVAAMGLAALLSVVAYTPIVRRPVAALIRSDPAPPRPAQAVVVLSAGIKTDGHLDARAADRLLTGISLVRRGAADGTIIVSRSRWGGPRYRVTSDADQQRLVGLLERPVRLLVVDSVYSTRDEAVRMRALTRPLGITSVAVVTSPTHTRRACATFEKVGFTVTCVPSESRDVPLGSLRLPADRVRALQLWLYELAGTTVYRARGWI